MNENQLHRIPFSEIILLVSKLFERHGCNVEDTKNITHSLVMAEACGVTSHGISMIKPYINKIIQKEYNITSDIIINKQTEAFSQINCNNTIGMTSATKCIQHCINKAKESGIHIVFANHCNTYSAAFVYTKIAAENGVIAYTISNSPAQMAPIGGKSLLLGTNPLSYAIPAKIENPIIFDMATSIVAKSKINQAAQQTVSIPEGWALDSNGNPTNNPLEAIKGIILPMAGAKGYGLSLMIDVFAGLLSGAACLNDVGRFYNSTSKEMNVGQFFLCIDPKIIYGNSFYTDMDNYIQRIRNSTPIDGQKIQLPGDKKYKLLMDSIENGIVVSEDFLKEIEQL